MSNEQFERMEDNGLNGFRRVQRPGRGSWGFQQVDAAREAAVTSAMRLVSDVLQARTPAYVLREAIQPVTPEMMRAIDANYPGLVRTRESMSVSDFPLLMGDVLDRMLLQRFRERPGAWRRYIRVSRPLRDFRTVRRIKTDGGDGRWDQLTEYGGLEYTKISESGYTYAPELYGKGMKLSFRALMNDDLGAFEEIPAILGRGGRRTVAYAATNLLFDANGARVAYYTALSGNPVFSVNALGTAIQTMMEQTDSEGEPIDISGVRLVHGPGLSVTVQNVLNSLTVDYTTDGGTSGRTIRVNNWLVQGIEPVMDPYIPIVASSANGATSWALVADPNNGRPAAELGFLVGFDEPALYQKAPNTQRAGGALDPMAGDFYSMAQEYKGVIGYGGTRMEPKAAVMSTGAGS